jgi:hypothetical protein
MHACMHAQRACNSGCIQRRRAHTWSGVVEINSRRVGDDLVKRCGDRREGVRRVEVLRDSDIVLPDDVVVGKICALSQSEAMLLSIRLHSRTCSSSELASHRCC